MDSSLYADNHLDIKKVSSLVKEILFREIDRLWLVAFQVYNIYEQSTFEYLSICMPEVNIPHKMSWLNQNDTRPQFIDDFLEYFLNEFKDNGEMKHEWDLISIGSILIHLILDSTSSVKLNGSYALNTFYKIISIIDLIICKLSNIYVMYSKIPEKCLVRTLALFTHLLKFYNQLVSSTPSSNHLNHFSTDSESYCMSEHLLVNSLNSLNSLLGTYSQNMSSQSHFTDQQTYVKFKFLLSLIQNVLIPNTFESHSLNPSRPDNHETVDAVAANSSCAIGRDYEHIFNSIATLIRRSHDKSLRREIITHIVTPVLNLVFSDVKISMSKTDIETALITANVAVSANDLLTATDTPATTNTTDASSSGCDTSHEAPLHPFQTIRSSSACVFSQNQKSLTKLLFSLVLQLVVVENGKSNNHSQHTSDQDVDVGSSVLIICLLFSLSATIIETWNKTAVSVPLLSSVTEAAISNKKTQKMKSKQKQASYSVSSNKTDDTHTNYMTACVECSLLQLLLTSTSFSSESHKLLCVRFWSVVQAGLQHPTDVLLRKRCVFILQFMLRCWKHSISLFSYDSNALNELAASSQGCSEWQESWTLLTDIFTHVEGSNSAHLVAQLMPALDKLFHIVATTATVIENSEDDLSSMLVFNSLVGVWFPRTSFHWIKSLLHCMLHQNVPVIRRLALYRLFSSRLAVRVNESFIKWFCEDLLCNFIDTASYFSAFFLDASYDLGCQAAVLEINYSYSLQQQNCSSTSYDHFVIVGGPTVVSENNQSAGISTVPAYSNIHKKLQREPLSPDTYPGVLLPYFLTTIFARCAALNNSASANISVSLTRSLLRVVCKEDGIQSLSAMKWVFRPFLEDCVLHLLPKCLTLDDYALIRQFVRGRLHSSNSFVRNQIVSGLLPFLLHCTAVQDDANSLELVLTLLDLLVHDFKLSRSLLRVDPFNINSNDNAVYHHHRNLKLFQSLINQALSVHPSLASFHKVDGSRHTHEAHSMKLLAILTCASVHHQTQGPLSALCQAVVSDLASLYSTVYKSVAQARQCVRYLYGVLYSIKCSVIYQIECATTSAIRIHSVRSNDNYLRLEHLPLTVTRQTAEYIVGHMADITSYLLAILRPVLQQNKSQSGDNVSTSAIIDDISLLEMVLRALTGLLLLVKITSLDASTNSTYSVSLSASNCNTALNKTVFAVATESLLQALASVCSLLSEEITAATTKASLHLSVLLRSSAVLAKDLSRFYKPSFIISRADDNSTDVLFIQSLKKLYTALLQSSQYQISAHAFKQYLTESSNHYQDNTNHSVADTSLSADIAMNLCRQQFSRFSDFNLTNRWSAVSSLLCLLPMGSSTSAPDYRDNNNILDIHYLLQQLEVCSPSSVVSLLICCRYALHSYINTNILYQEDASKESELQEEEVGTILSTCWRVSVTGVTEQVETDVVTAFIELMFVSENIHSRVSAASSSVTNKKDTCITTVTKTSGGLLSWSGGIILLKTYFDKLLALAQTCRPYIVLNIAYHLSNALCRFPGLVSATEASDTVHEMIMTLLLYKEPLLDDNNLSNELSGTTDAFRSTNFSRLSDLLDHNNNQHKDISSLLNDLGVEINMSRLMVLTALQHIIHTKAPEHISEGIYCLMRKLLQMNLLPKYSATAMIGSDLYGEKLRCFQALCVLSSSLDSRDTAALALVDELIPIYFKILNDNVVLSIRVFIEIFGASLGRSHPVKFLAYMKEELEQYNHSQQKIASLFVILGHLFIDEQHDVHIEADANDPYAYMNDVELLRSFCYLLQCWMSCSQGLPRGIAMLVFHTLYTRLQSVRLSTSKCAHDEQSSRDTAALGGVYQYLSQNKDCVKSLQRQKEFFTEFSLSARCSVVGLVALLQSSDGSSQEICPDHLLTVLENHLKSTLYSETTTSATALARQTSITRDSTHSDRKHVNKSDDEEQEVVYTTLQTKRVPFSEIQLTLNENVSLRKLNTAGNTKQPLVVCATLVDKVVNIAGIARTCEIFAVEELVIANKIITKTEAFQGIAVNSGDWLNISQVSESDLVSWLRSMKRRNYVIVALEQSDAAQSLASDDSSSLPAKCVLLLGKEKEGVPVHLLNEVDICVEIPQLGVTRSLNVHVSAAIFIWEFTRRCYNR